MLALPKQFPVEISLCDGEVWITQKDIDGDEHVVSIAISNVPKFIEALKTAIEG